MQYACTVRRLTSKHDSPPIEELGEPLDGFQCSEEDCSFITVNINKMRMHRKKEHELPWRGDNDALYQRVKVQTFFRTGGLQRYFVVNAGDSSAGDVNSAPSAPRDVADNVKTEMAEWETAQKEEEQRMQLMDAAVAKTDQTGWPEHFAGRNLAHLAHQARLPDRGEVKLQLAAALVEGLVERSVRGLSTLDRESRRWLRSARRDDPDPRPLARLQNAESQARYASYMVRFVCYFLRIIADEEARAAQRSGGEASDNSDEQGHDGDKEAEEEEEEEDEEEESDRGSDMNRTARSSRSARSARSGESEDDAGSNSSSRRPQRRKKKTDYMKDARELFCWQGSQRLRAMQLWAALEGGDRGAQMRVLLDTLTAFFFASTGGKPLSNGLIHFLAVLGIDAELGRLCTAKNYSYMLAGVVYCVRVLSVEKLLPSACRDEQTDDDRQLFLAARKQYLADGSYSPMSETINMLAYSKHVALEAGNAGNAYWSRDKKIFYLHGRRIYISRFRKMAQDVVTEAEQMLWQELCWVARKEDRFAVELDKVVDDVSFTKRRYSFMSRRENGLDRGLEWMLTQAKQTEEGRRLYSSDGKWNVKQVRRYLRCVDRFLALLLVGKHMVSGQPGRGSEVTTIRFQNGLLQDRNVVIVDGQVMTVVRYYKSQSQWDKPRVVPRFLPPRLGQVMVMYLAYVRPFREYLTVKVLGGSFSDYVWADEHGQPWGTDRLTRALQRETGKRLGVELHTLDYRHAAVGIGREKVGPAFGKGYQDEMGEVDDAEVDEGEEDLIELQNARTTAIGVSNYSVPIDIVKHLSARSIEAFRTLSNAWHSFLGVEKREAPQEEARTSNVDSSRRAKKRRRSDDDSEDEEEEKEEEEGREFVRRQKPFRVSNVKETVIRRAMQQVLGQEEVSFRSVEQEQALHAVMDRQTPLVVVLPTGGGKSLLFSVPACLTDAGVTVVVVPYRALMEDLVSRMQKCGIDCIEWKHGESNPASVVVVSADMAGDTRSNGNFIGYANMPHSKGLLRRVVVDECHLIFTSSDWRPKLAELKNLRLLPCPIVLLTATLPPVREGELATSMLVPCATYIRASTVRPNTQYYVSWCERGKAQETAVAMCRRQQQLLLSRGWKGVVYCRSKQQCEELAEVVGCGCYHADVPDRGDRVKQWLLEGGLMTATSALGTGVDFPGIVFILHVGMPWSMIDYAQESGRGGRAGERVDSVVLVEQGEVERMMKQKSDDLDVQAMGMFLIGSGCRRGLMSSYLDGKRVECNDTETAGCDRCGEGVRGWHDAQPEASVEWQQVEELMDELRNGCVACCMLDDAGTTEWQQHKTMQCTAHPGVTGMELDAFRRGIHDRGGSHSCRRCWVSQKYCATREDVQKQCQWPNVVVPLARTAAELDRGVWIIREQCGYGGELGGDWKEYAAWLGKRHRERVWGEYFSNAMVVAIRVVLFMQQYNSAQVVEIE